MTSILTGNLKFRMHSRASFTTERLCVLSGQSERCNKSFPLHYAAPSPPTLAEGPIGLMAFQGSERLIDS